MQSPPGGATAAAGLEEAAKLDPRSPEIGFFLGACHLLTDHNDAAISELRRTIALGETPFLEEARFYLVFHGGSGSDLRDIHEALDWGVVKMNIDTDTQWATWEGVLNYYKANEAYLQGQLGNPKGEDQPNKKYYDPRVWLRAGQTSMIARLEKAFQELNAIDVL